MTLWLIYKDGDFINGLAIAIAYGLVLCFNIPGKDGF